MTQQAQQELETRFQALKSTMTPQQWSDSSYLLAQVDVLEETDVALAFRLMQRIRNIQNNEQNQQRLKELRAKALQAEPELAQTSSQEPQAANTLLNNTQQLRSRVSQFWSSDKRSKLTRPFFIFVLLPFFLFTLYQLLIASDRFESQAQLIVKEPDSAATLDPAMALISGFGVGSGNLDTELVKAFIHSNDMLTYLQDTLSITEHYSDHSYDFFSRLDSDASREDILEYYLRHVLVELDEKSQVISVFVQAFEPEYAHLVSQTIVSRAEWFINEIGHNLAKEQLRFVKLEHELVEQRLQQAKSNLLSFQRRHNLLDPQAEGMAFQQIAYRLESEIAAKRTELRVLKSNMSDNAPQVKQAQNQLDSMLAQLSNERERLTDEKQNQDDSMPDGEENLSVSQVLAKFSDYRIDMELALKAYTSSQVSLEKSRIEAYRQLKYLVTVESPTLPQEAKYPEVLYNIGLFLVINLMLFGVGRIVIATVDELR